MQIYFYSK